MKTHTGRYTNNTAATRMGQYVKAPAVQRLTPKPRPKGTRDWAAVDIRSITCGDVLAVFGGADTLRVLAVRDTTGRGHPAINRRLLLLMTIVQIVSKRSDRQMQGFMRGVFRLADIPLHLVPHYSRLCKFRPTIDYDELLFTLAAASIRDQQVVYVAVDATGVSLTKTGGWATDKPGSTDTRRGRYRKLHTAVNTQNGEVVCWQLTDSSGPGSADVSVGPALVRAVPDTVMVVCGDGAYTSTSMFDAAVDADVTLLVPLPGTAVYGAHPDRDVLLTQQSRLGRKEWKERSGYHQRSVVEAVYATMDRQSGNSLRTRRDDSQEVEMAVKVQWHNHVRRAA